MAGEIRKDSNRKAMSVRVPIKYLTLDVSIWENGRATVEITKHRQPGQCRPNKCDSYRYFKVTYDNDGVVLIPDQKGGLTVPYADLIRLAVTEATGIQEGTAEKGEEGS